MVQVQVVYLWQFIYNAFSHFGGEMTDVDTLQSQLLPTPLINKSPYDVLGLKQTHICIVQLDAVDSCPLKI